MVDCHRRVYASMSSSQRQTRCLPGNPSTVFTFGPFSCILLTAFYGGRVSMVVNLALFAAGLVQGLVLMFVFLRISFGPRKIRT